MQEPTYILDQRPENKGLDAQWLRKQGIQYLQELTNLWTDYNDHDPGVTILEVLCYALTELSYKADLDVKDILFSSKDSTNFFYKPQDVYTSHPTSHQDYRKIIIDAIPEIKNIWFFPYPESRNTLKGLYQIIIELDESTQSLDEQKASIIHKVKEIFAQNRSLCEDIEEVKIAETINLSIKADIEVEEIGNLEHILANVYSKANQMVSPNIPFYSFEDLSQEGWKLKDIFAGPTLKHGFIKDEDLKEKIDKILISDIIKMIMQIKGVVSIKNLALITENGEVFDNQIIVDKYIVPRFILPKDNKQGIRFFKGLIENQNIYYQEVFRLLNEFYSKNKRIYRIEKADKESLLNKDQRNITKEIEEYYSIQNDFPDVYGIGEEGIPGSPNVRRKAEAKQLKGYLLLFEQILANYLSQLAHAKQLFSSSQIEQTYFYQYLNTVPDVQNLLQRSQDMLTVDKNLPLDYKSGLPVLMSDKKSFLDRRNRFLDFILAIYGESIYEYPSIQKNYYYTGKTFDEYSLKVKGRFLYYLNYLNQNKNKASNYLKGYRTTNNISGVESKMNVLFGLNFTKEDPENEPIKRYSPFKETNKWGLKLIDSNSAEKDINQWKKVTDLKELGLNKKQIFEHFDYLDEEDIMIDLDSEKVAEYVQQSNPLKHKILDVKLLQYGIYTQNYLIGKSPKQKDFSVVLKLEDNYLWLGNYPTIEETNIAAGGLRNLMIELNIKSEGFFLLENILLRPETEDKKFGFYILDEKGKPFLQTAEEFDFPKRKKLIEDLEHHLTDYENYDVERREDGNFEVHLQIKDMNLTLKSIKNYESVQEIHNKMEQVYDFLANKHDLAPYNEKIELYIKDKDDEKEIPESFYNFQVSCFMPNWTSRFSDNEFRKVFEETLLQILPSHISFKCFWFGVDEMRTVEKLFNMWLNAKQKSTKEDTQVSENIISDFLYNVILK